MRTPINHRIQFRVALLFIIAATIIFITAIIFLLRGNLAVTTTPTTNSEYSSINCIADDIHYPFFDEEYSHSKITVNIILDTELRAISLAYMTTYEKSELANKSMTLNSIKLNQMIEQTAQIDALSPRFVQDGNTVYMNIYSDNDKFTDYTKTFFLINEIPSTDDGYILNYEEQGFTCKVK